MHALQRWISKALTHRGRCYSQTEAPAGIPKALFGLLEPSPVALSIVSLEVLSLNAGPGCADC